MLRAHRFAGHKFRRQQPVGPFFVDFVCYERRLVVEVDGAQHVERAEYDAARTRWLERDGYRVLRFTDREVLTALDGVQEALLLALEAEAPSPQPSPARGEGVGSGTPSPLMEEGEGEGGESHAPRADLVIAVLNEREGAAAVEQEYLGLARALRDGGTAIVAASSTAATRLLDGPALPRGMRATRYKHRGTSVITLTRD